LLLGLKIVDKFSGCGVLGAATLRGLFGSCKGAGRKDGILYPSLRESRASNLLITAKRFCDILGDSGIEELRKLGTLSGILMVGG
jgi:hypothetical protein